MVVSIVANRNPYQIKRRAKVGKYLASSLVVSIDIRVSSDKYYWLIILIIKFLYKLGFCPEVGIYTPMSTEIGDPRGE